MRPDLAYIIINGYKHHLHTNDTLDVNIRKANQLNIIDRL